MSAHDLGDMELLTALSAFPKYGEGPSLPRVAAFMRRHGIDRAALARRSLAVVGSNGKGSTATMTAAIARGHGLRCGLFTSPHLMQINERIQIASDPIDPARFAALLDEVTAFAREMAAAGMGAVGGFEATFYAALMAFLADDLDLLVWEAGIGGRCDAVRGVGATCAALTSIDLEHTALLGSTFALI
ncbi:MAG: bifunctional folylpolyglutamate synthase/dihydrofolate synthase, partial [Pseudomonadota bacterium]